MSRRRVTENNQKRRRKSPAAPRKLRPPGIAGMAKGGPGGKAPRKKGLCEARYDTASPGLVFCTLDAEPTHKVHVNAEHDATWHDDYVPNEAE